MKTLSILILSTVSFLFSVSFSQAPFINQVWETPTGSPTPSKDRTSSSLDPNGNFVFVGTKNNGNNTDIFLNCIHPNGAVAWEQVCPSSANEDDWGTDLRIDNAGNLFVCGVRSNGQNQDYFVAKYSGSGNLLWQYSYDFGGDDLPEAIDIDVNGDVFVTGTSQGGNSLNDFATVKIDGNTGVEIWSSRYDFLNHEEKAVDLKVDPSGNVIVCGTSFQNPVDSRFTLLKYDHANGNEIAVKRHNSPAPGYDLPYELICDQANNYYVVGTANKNSTDSDIKLIKYNNSLNVSWVNYIDYHGLNDEGVGICLISSAFVAITGTSSNQFGGSEFVTALYSIDGNYLWNHNRLGDQELTEAGGFDVVADNLGHLYVTGYVEEDGLKKYRTAGYHLNGQLYWERTFEVPNRDLKATQIVEKNGSITIVGDSKGTNDGDFVSVRYDVRERDQSPHINQNNGEADYADRHLIVKVNPDIVKTSEIDAGNNEFWTLDQIFTPAAADSIQAAIDSTCGSPKCGQVTVYKIFRGLKTTQTSATSRLDQQVNVPKFWSTFVFEFSSNVDILAVHEEFKSLFPDIVLYSHVNPVCTIDAIADDSDYNGSQATLHPISPFSPNSHINVEPAWDIETGKSFVKCGVFDTGARYSHEDFGDGTQFGNIVIDGYDYFTGSDFYNSTSQYYHKHGTNVTGIIGAIRNNDLGVAGIAGGNDDIGEPGVQFYELIILDPTPVDDYYDYIADAIFESSIDDPGLNAGFGINVANHSWGFDGNAGQQYTYANVVLMRENTHFANRMGVTQVCSRGNTFASMDNGVRYPAMADDKWILNVTQTGTDGEWKDGVSTFGNEDACLSFIEGDIDIGASGVLDMTWTTDINADDSYGNFSCSSGAAPHVTGVVSLLMSRHNDPNPNYQNLAPEDCEEIIQQTAVDINDPGVDDLTGYGRIDAGQALNLVNDPDCYLEHYGTSSSPNTKSSTQVANYITVTMSEYYENTNGDYFNGGPYKANVYKISADIQYNPIANPYTESAIWPRHSSSTLFPLYDLSSPNGYFQPREEITIDSYGNTIATMHGYVYELFDFQSGQFVGWVPHDNNLANAELEFTLVRCNQNFFTGVSIDEIEAQNSINLYPNPTSEGQILSISLIERTDVVITLIDNTGKLVKEVFSQNNCEGELQIENDLSGLASGFYTYQIVLGNEIKYIKAIKQ